MNNDARVIVPRVIRTAERIPVAKSFSAQLERLQKVKKFEITRIHDSKDPHSKLFVFGPAADLPAKKIIPIIKEFKIPGVMVGYFEPGKTSGFVQYSSKEL